MRLDDYLDESTDEKAPLGLKIDVQGFESSVIDGAERHFERIKVIYLEMPLADLYVGGQSFAALSQRLIDAGFRCISLSPGFIDRERYEVLEVDGLFVRERHS
jgi:hypothetical protein